MHTTALIDRQGKGSMFRYLKRFLQDVCPPTLPVFLTAFFCSRKIVILSWSPPTGSHCISDGHENMPNTWFLKRAFVKLFNELVFNFVGRELGRYSE
jgi:hypothetical protein